MKFNEMSISARTLAALTEIGYLEATEVQAKTIPLILQGDDVIVRSQTGTGKTAAFGIGFLEIIMKDRTRKGLVLAPTRELAVQITREIRSIAKNTNLHVFAIYGGQGMGGQIALLRKGFDIIVATPGRLLDHVHQGTLRLEHINCVVLDEADRMLDIGFKPDIDRIMRMVDRDSQVVLSSATIDSAIKQMAKNYMESPKIIEVGPVGQVQKIEEEFITLNRAEKMQHLKEILRREPNSRTLIFVASKRGVEYVCDKLNDNQIEAGYLHGGKTQGQRERVLRDFQEGRIMVLVATDIAARGIHVEDISHVISYDRADTKDTHTHRIGRTGRMGKAGKAITFVETDPIARGRGGGGGRNQRGGQRSGPRGNYGRGKPQPQQGRGHYSRRPTRRRH
ncbi:MAG: DEAD/DEAH box helicase [Candidatus Micrarchaeota archaeon]